MAVSFYLLAQIKFPDVFKLNKENMNDLTPKLLSFAQAFGDQGQVLSKIKILNLITQHDPKSFEANLNIANTLLDDNELDISLKYYKKAEQLYPNNDYLLYNFGRYYKISGDIDKAKEYWKKSCSNGFKFSCDEIN